MAPKFRGGSDDWLDDEDSRSSQSLKRKPATGDRALPLPPEQANATVSEVFPNQCRVRMDEDTSELLCGYRRATVFRHDDDARERSPVAVGDRVRVARTSPGDGVVEGLCRRTSFLSRPAPGRDRNPAGRMQHVIAANVEELVIVASAGEPEFNPGLVDRYLTAAAAAGIHPILCLNKIDREAAGGGELGSRPTHLYRNLGYETVEVSAKALQGTAELRLRLLGRSVVFCGQSGVGKTSLLRALLGEQVGRVGEVSVATGKGRHTTTGAILLRGPGDSRWIDTPGIREFGLSRIEATRLAGYFPELRELRCRIESCLHRDEGGCLARDLPRYASYRRILESLLAGEG